MVKISKAVRFDQEMWHWMPCRPTWTHVVYWYAKPGDRLAIHFTVPEAGHYSVELNLCMSPGYGRQRLSVNGKAVDEVIDGYSSELFWLHPKLGVFDIKKGDNVLEVEALEPNPEAEPGNRFGLDYIFLIRQ